MEQGNKEPGLGNFSEELLRHEEDIVLELARRLFLRKIHKTILLST